MEIVNESPGLRGSLRLVTWDGDVSDTEALAYLDGLWLPGRVVRDVTQRNLITNVGRALVTSLGVAAGGTAYGWIAVGTSAITPAATNTTLTGELTRKACSTVAVLSTYYMRFVTNFTTGDFNATVLGFGLFDAAAAGNMGAIVSANVLKDSSHSLLAEWRWNVLAS